MSTLTTKRIRDLYGMATRWDSDERTASVRESNLAEFDAWLAQYRAQVLTEAGDHIRNDEMNRHDRAPAWIYLWLA